MEGGGQISVSYYTVVTHRAPALLSTIIIILFRSPNIAEATAPRQPVCLTHHQPHGPGIRPDDDGAPEAVGSVLRSGDQFGV